MEGVTSQFTQGDLNEISEMERNGFSSAPWFRMMSGKARRNFLQALSGLGQERLKTAVIWAEGHVPDGNEMPEETRDMCNLRVCPFKVTKV